MAAPPELNTDAVSEILLRLPPDDPAGLVRASAVCKRWLRTLTDPAFLRSYRHYHGMPRVLGFLRNSGHESFVPTTTFRPHAAAAAHHTCRVLDCRHGRVLLYNSSSSEFVVWDPVTGRERRIPDERRDYYYHNNHAVLCAAGASCDHSTCSGGPFLLACAGVHSSGWCESFACSYSSETGAWSAQTSWSQTYLYSLGDRPAVLAGDALYFDAGNILRYDVLGGRGLLLMELPPCDYDSTMVMTAANGELGLATFDYDDMLVLWSAETSMYSGRSSGFAKNVRWSQMKVIDLQKLLPIDIPVSSSLLSLSGFAEDANLIFLSTVENGIFTIDLKSLLARKVCEMSEVDIVIPYVSFYTPAACARGALQPLLETLLAELEL